MIRILVTGSRAWTDRQAVERTLGAVFDAVHSRLPEVPLMDGIPVTLVSGACPNGADRIAEQVATDWGWTVERHPADWNRWGRGAAFRRNAEMAGLGADVCVPFHLNGSPGTAHCIEQAQRRGIPIWPDDFLGDEFARHADESLAIANETFETAVALWPEV